MRIFRVAMMLVLLAMWTLFWGTIVYTSYYPLYEPQEDPGKIEWYPATLVAKDESQQNFTLRLSDNSIARIHVSQSDFEKYNIGGSVSFERHITDPAVVNHTMKVHSWRIFAILVFFIAGFALLITLPDEE